MATTYKALVGLNYPGTDGADKRLEVGQTADDIPAKSVKWLLEQGLIEAASAVPAPAAEEDK